MFNMKLIILIEINNDYFIYMINSTEHYLLMYIFQVIQESL